MKRYRIGLLLYLLLILVASSIPGESYPKLDVLNADKLIHTVEYGILGFLLLKAFPWNRGFPFLGLILFGILFGVFDEWYQQFTPNRFPSHWDAIADSLCVIIWATISRYGNLKNHD